MEIFLFNWKVNLMLYSTTFEVGLHYATSVFHDVFPVTFRLIPVETLTFQGSRFQPGLGFF